MSSRCLAFQVLAGFWGLSFSGCDARVGDVLTCAAEEEEAQSVSTHVLLQTHSSRVKREHFDSGRRGKQELANQVKGDAGQAGAWPTLVLGSQNGTQPNLLHHRSWLPLPEMSVLQTAQRSSLQRGMRNMPSKRRAGAYVSKKSPKQNSPRRSKKNKASNKSQSGKKAVPFSRKRYASKAPREQKDREDRTIEAASAHKGGSTIAKHSGFPHANSAALTLKKSEKQGRREKDEKKSLSFAEQFQERLIMVRRMVSMMVLPVTCFLLITGCMMVYAIDSEMSDT